jgi:hypothetical protein
MASTTYNNTMASPSILGMASIYLPMMTGFSNKVILLFTGQLGVEAAEGEGEGLEGRQRVPEVHGEHILRNLAKLQYHLIVLGRRLRSRVRRGWGSSRGLRGGGELEVLHGSDGHAATEVEAPALQLLVPSWGLVVEDQGRVLALIIIARRLPSRPRATTEYVGEPGAAETHRMVHGRRFRDRHAAERFFV